MIKKKSLFITVLSMILMMTLLLPACGAKKPSTIEELIKSNDEVKQEIEAATENTGLTVDVKGNDVYYTFDLSTIDGITEEQIKDPAMVETLTGTLDQMDATFTDICTNLESKTGIKGIKMIVEYKYGDEVIGSKTFTAGGASEE